VQISERGPQERLAEQLPEARFPGGVGSPSIVVLLLLLLLAGVCAAALRTSEPRRVPDELLISQQQLAENVARSIGISARQSTADLRTGADLSTGGPAELVAAIQKSHPRWKGTVLLDGSSRKVLAASGETVPTEALPPVLDGTVRPLVGPGGEVRMLVAVPLSGRGREGRVVAALSTARLAGAPVDASLKQGLLLAAGDGRVLDFQGNVPGAADTATRSLVARAVAAARSGKQGTEVGEPTRGASPAAGERAAVVGYAPVAADGMSGTLGLVVLSVVQAPIMPAESDWRGLTPAAALAVLALLTFGLIRLVVVSPVRRLRNGALAVAGGRLRSRVGVFRVREARRIAAGIEHCRMALRGIQPEPPRRRVGVSAGLAVAVASLGVLGWSGGVAATVGRDDVAVPRAVVTAARSQVGNTAEAMRRSLNDGLADLRAVAVLSKGQRLGSLEPALERLTTGQSRYRGVYVVGPAGRPELSVGRTPLRDSDAAPRGEGIKQHNTRGRVPVVYAHAPLPDGKRTLIAEFDLDHLTGLLERASGRVRVVDSGSRTIIANRGYLAFERLSDAALRAGAERALAGKPVAGVADVSGERSVLVSRTLGGRGAAGSLRWVLVADQPVGALALAGNELRRDAQMVALVGVVLALVLFGWHHFVVVRPLRRVAAAADQLVAGDTTTVIYPQRQDQVGTIACCLEICRQAMVDGVGRLGQVRRPAGAATDATMLLPSVVAPGRDRPVPVGAQRRRVGG
jgi:hypothetical protein